MKRQVAYAASKALSVTANLFATTQCLYVGHRPEVPQELKK